MFRQSVLNLNSARRCSRLRIPISGWCCSLAGSSRSSLSSITSSLSYPLPLYFSTSSSASRIIILSPGTTKYSGSTTSWSHTAMSEFTSITTTATTSATTTSTSTTAPTTTPPTPPKPLEFADGPLVWIDCEMTGLDPQRDRILEIAVRNPSSI